MTDAADDLRRTEESRRRDDAARRPQYLTLFAW
jgi:hypothetical protein